MLEDIMRHIPRVWKVGARTGKIDIISESNSDWSSNFTDFSMQACSVIFEMPIATDPEDVPMLSGKTKVTPK
jgi:hypothetical protein